MGRPFYVSEFGDWGLPDMPALDDPAFWDTRAIYADALSGTLWPATIGRFVRETQRYQGVSDRLQTEVWRRHDDIGGYCLTELTDVPHELNGLLDLHRNPKPLAMAEMARANQTVLPMLELPSLVAASGEEVRGEVHVANDGPALEDVEVEVRFGDTAPPVAASDIPAIDAQALDLDAISDRFTESLTAVRSDRLAAHAVAHLGPVTVVVPDAPGNHDLVLRLRAGGELVSENRYPIHIVDRRPVVRSDIEALVIEEGELDASSGTAARTALDEGGIVVVFAQSPDAAAHYPVPVQLDEVQTTWGSTVFHFTTDHGALPSLPRRNVLVAEDSTVQATSVVSRIDGRAFPDTPVVIAFKPVPGAMAGTIVGSHGVGRGRLITCQYRLRDRASSGDVAASALRDDILRWATVPREVLAPEPRVKDDGRAMTLYRFETAVAR